MSARDIGAYGESLAADFLKKKGFRILERNRHESHNETDIIAANKEFIVFAEVKTRNVIPRDDGIYGSAAAAVTYAKQTRLLAAAMQYLRTHPKYATYQPRLDVVEVYLDKQSGNLLQINHIENAFGR